jgi:hypothetical protein
MKYFFLAFMLLFTRLVEAQTIDSTQTPSFFSGVITATNNGVSLLPNLTLGKPAALFDLSIGKGRWSFDPMLRFSMEGKPWAFVFWGRYKLFANPKFTMSVGVHPAFIFRTVTLTNANGVTNDYLTSQTYLALETTPTYFFHKKIGVGLHYLGSHGLDKDGIQYTTFLSFRSIISNIKIYKEFHLSFVPQFYYLKMDAKDGFYTSAFVSLSKTKFPISLSSILSKKLTQP